MLSPRPSVFQTWRIANIYPWNTGDMKVDNQNRSLFRHDKYVEFHTQSRLKSWVETDIVVNVDFFVVFRK